MTRIYSVALLLALAPPILAGELPELLEKDHNEFWLQWLKPSVDIRARYEFREVDGLDPSHSLTLRTRPGLLFGDPQAGSAFVQWEDTRSIIDDYDATAGAPPHRRGNTPITDPRNSELNQAWVQLGGPETHAKGGRQVIIRNDAAFVGNVGWRQNEQTFDAGELAWKSGTFHASYAYAWRVQRIFGQHANRFGKELEGDFHLLDAGLDLGNGARLAAYAYLLDTHDNGGASMNIGRSNTLGAFYQDDTWHAEAAFQEGRSALVPGGSYNALYLRFWYQKEMGDWKLKAGTEYLGKNFKTPLATVHAYNGLADAFTGQRMGINNLGGHYRGMTDIHAKASYQGLPDGWSLQGALYYFADDSLASSYGYETDLTLSKKLNDNLTLSWNLALFFDTDGNQGYNDIVQATADLSFTW